MLMKHLGISALTTVCYICTRTKQKDERNRLQRLKLFLLLKGWSAGTHVCVYQSLLRRQSVSVLLLNTRVLFQSQSSYAAPCVSELQIHLWIASDLDLSLSDRQSILDTRVLFHGYAATGVTVSNLLIQLRINSDWNLSLLDQQSVINTWVLIPPLRRYIYEWSANSVENNQWFGFVRRAVTVSGKGSTQS